MFYSFLLLQLQLGPVPPSKIPLNHLVNPEGGTVESGTRVSAVCLTIHLIHQLTLHVSLPLKLFERDSPCLPFISLSRLLR